jgi:hypothetical protein
MTSPDEHLLPDDVAALFAIERTVPAPPDAMLDTVWAQIHLELNRDSAAARFARRMGPEAVIVVAFLLGVGAVIAAIRPRTSHNDPRAVVPLDQSPESPGGDPRVRPPPRPTPLRGAGAPTETPIQAPTRSPVLAPPLVLPTLPPPPPRRIAVPSMTDGGAFMDAGLLRPRRDTTLEEGALLEIARGALRRNQPTVAFDAIRLHLARFPDGVLAEEREALAIRALELSGHADEARARAALFHQAWPDSPLP